MRATPVTTAEPATAEPATIELDYLAVCIAEQIVRITLSAVRRKRANEQARDTSPILTQPLMALATSLGIQDQVRRHVADVLPGAML